MAVPAQVNCYMCKADAGAAEAQCVSQGKTNARDETADILFRCNKCNRVKTRISRCFIGRDDLKRGYEELAPCDKIEFIRNSHELRGPSLVKSVEMKLKQASSSTRGREHYSHPKSYNCNTCRNRLEKAPQWVHPDTKETVWCETKVSSSDRKSLTSNVLTMKRYSERPKQPRAKRLAIKDGNTGEEDGPPSE